MSRVGERLHGLRWRLTAMRRLWSAGVRPGMTFMPSDRRGTEPVSEVDWPKAGDEIERGPLKISGWVMFPAGSTVRVEALVGGQPVGLARLGLPRPDVAESWDPPQAEIAGFELVADLSEWDGSDGATELRVVATGPNEERFELDPVALTMVGELERRAPKLAPPAPRTAPVEERGRPRVLVLTHQLSLGGGQLYLLDLLRELSRSTAATFTVLSSGDGPLRADLEALGMPVHISSLVPYDDLSSHVGRVEELATWAEGRGEFDVALVNTATAWTVPGVEAAELLGIPVVWAIHESFPPAVLFSEMTPAIHERAEAALARAEFLVFEAEETKRLFEPLSSPERCLLLPYGLDLAPIDAAIAGFDPAGFRAAEGIPADAEAIVCIGTVEPRKAQAMLAQAFDSICERHPRARLFFVGGREDIDSEALRNYIASPETNDRMRLIDITPDVQPWYGLADVLVCASDVESLPRTVLEAMAWRTPVLATDVFGLPEVIADGETGWLCEPRDLEALAAALDRALRVPAAERARIGAAARELVVERHRLAAYGSQIADLLERATAEAARS